MNFKSAKCRVLLIYLIVFIFGGSSLNAQGGVDTITVKPIVQVSAEPIFGECHLLTNRTVYYPHPPGPPQPQPPTPDTLEPEWGFVSCPYQLVLNFEVSFSAPDPLIISLVDSIEFVMTLDLRTDVPRKYRVPPPRFRFPGFTSFSRIVSTLSSGGLNNENLFFFYEGQFRDSSRVEISFNPSDSINMPSFFQKRQFVLPKVSNLIQRYNIALQGGLMPEKSVTQDFYLRDGGGILVLLDEVIDPSNTVEFSLKITGLYTKDGELLVINEDDSLSRMTIQFASSLPDSTGYKSDNQNFIFRNFTDSLLPHFVELEGPMGIYSRDICFRTLKEVKPGMERNDFSYLIAEKEDGKLTGRLILKDTFPDEPDANLGLVSNGYKDGFVPLFIGKNSILETQFSMDTTITPPLKEEEYSLCIQSITSDFVYHTSGILCWVIAPQDGRTPCPP